MSRQLQFSSPALDKVIEKSVLYPWEDTAKLPTATDLQM
jgi:hypothetical protein